MEVKSELEVLVFPLRPPPHSSSTERAEWDLSFKLFVPTTYTRDLRGEIEGRACSVCSESTGTTEISEDGRSTNYSNSNPLHTSSGSHFTYPNLSAPARSLAAITSAQSEFPTPILRSIVWTNQLYTATFNIRQRIPDALAAVEGTTDYIEDFNLGVDTGSNHTWACWYLYKVEPFSGDNRTVAVNRPPHRPTLFYPPTKPDPSTDANGSYGDLTYANGSLRAKVMLAHRRYDLELVHCYSWSTKRWYSPLRFQLRLSAAYYVSLNLAYAGHHGLVGLGLSECQDCVGETADTAPSFLRAIQQHALGVLPESNTRHAGGKAMFFAIRPPLLPHEAARTDPEKATSWMAINRWPCVAQPTWSDDIPLSPSEDPVAGRWSVRVESMSFVRGGTSTLSETVHTIRFEGGFLDMLLDTGCSVTWVPLQVINDIREHVFPNPDNPDLDLDLTGRGAGNISHPDFKAPYDASRNDLNNWRVEFYFKGFKEPVKVQCPIEDFICTKSQDPGSNVRDGLLYALPANYVGTPNMGILGLNFFQAMFVSMHKPDQGLPYMRFAANWSWKQDQFKPHETL